MNTINLAEPVYNYVSLPYDVNNKCTTLDLLKALQHTIIKVKEDTWGLEFHPILTPARFFFFGKKIPKEFTKVFGKVEILQHSGNVLAPTIVFLSLLEELYSGQASRREKALNNVRERLSLTADAEEYLVDKIILPLVDVYVNRHLNSPRENPVQANFDVKLVIGSLTTNS